MSNIFPNKKSHRLNSCQAKEEPRASAEVSALDQHLGYWLRSVSNHVSFAFQTKVEQHGVTVAEWVIMRALFSQDGMRPSDLASRVGLTRGAISKLLDRLAKKGLVDCKPDSTDARAQVVAISRKGRKMVPKLAALADANDAEMFGHLDAQKLELLRSILEAMAEFHGLTSAPID